MKRDFLEEDMYALVRDHFLELGFTVHGEVKACDIAALKDDTLVILELKKSLSMELLLQAVKRQRIGDLTYLCIPKPKNYARNRKFQDMLYLLKRLSLGLIFCDPTQELLEVVLEPQEFDMARSRKAQSARRGQLMKEIRGRTTSLNTGGSRGRKLMTAYREDTIRLLWLASRQPTIAPKDGTSRGIRKAGSMLRDNHYGWFEKTGRGQYRMTSLGAQALADYREIIPLLTDHLIPNDSPAAAVTPEPVPPETAAAE